MYLYIVIMPTHPVKIVFSVEAVVSQLQNELAFQRFAKSLT